MWTYLFSFTLAVGIVRFSQTIKEKKKSFVVGMIGVLIPCFLAAFRADIIGTDVRGYLKQITGAAIWSQSWKEYWNAAWFATWKYVYTHDFEIGFVFFVYMVAKIFRSIVAVQFFVQAAVSIPIYIALYKKREEYPVWLGMLVYYLMFYNTSLNTMRQFAAMGFLLLSMYYFMEENRKRYILYFAVAILFHNSALIGIFIAFIYKFVQNRSTGFVIGWGRLKLEEEYVNLILVLLAGLFVLFGTDVIIWFLKTLVNSKYIGYIAGDLKFMSNQVVIRLPAIVLFLVNWHQLYKADERTRFYFAMICLDLICSQFTSVNSFAGRISQWFSLFSILYYPSLCTHSKYKKITTILVVAYMLTYWIFYFAIRNSGETVPYVSVFG